MSPHTVYVNAVGRVRRTWLLRAVVSLITWVPVPDSVQCRMLRCAASLVQAQYKIGAGRWHNFGRFNVSVGEDDKIGITFAKDGADV